MKVTLKEMIAILDEERKTKQMMKSRKSEQKKVFHTPTAPPTKWHKDKKKYNRREKHKKDYSSDEN